jgi:hypothetical protein
VNSVSRSWWFLNSTATYTRGSQEHRWGMTQDSTVAGDTLRLQMDRSACGLSTCCATGILMSSNWMARWT